MAKKFQPNNSKKKPSGKVDWKRDPEKAAAKGIRLNRYIAHSGICSRREADRWIEMGRIMINGKQDERFKKLDERF